MRTMLLVLASVETKFISKPEVFGGKATERPRGHCRSSAFLRAVLGRMLELLRSAGRCRAKRGPC